MPPVKHFFSQSIPGKSYGFGVNLTFLTQNTWFHGKAQNPPSKVTSKQYFSFHSMKDIFMILKTKIIRTDL